MKLDLNLISAEGYKLESCQVLDEPPFAPRVALLNHVLCKPSTCIEEPKNARIRAFTTKPIENGDDLKFYLLLFVMQDFKILDMRPYIFCNKPMCDNMNPAVRGSIPFRFEECETKLTQQDNKCIHYTFGGWREPCTTNSQIANLAGPKP